MTSAIEIRHVRKRFTTGGRDVLALDGIDLDVAPGELVCLLGPSGCGKSTLLNLVAGLDAPTAGDVLVNGQPVHGPDTDRVMIFQTAALFPWLDVLGNVEFGLRMTGAPKREREEIARRYLRMVHLLDFEHTFVHQLSGGMKQRVALARALALDPDVLLMDEPFGALDAITRDLLHGELDRIRAQRGLTVLFVTHNVREAVRLGDRVVMLSSRPGRVIGEFAVPVSHPRRIDSAPVAELAATITGHLRQEMARHGS